MFGLGIIPEPAITFEAKPDVFQDIVFNSKKIIAAFVKRELRISPKRKMGMIMKWAGPMNAIKFELGI